MRRCSKLVEMGRRQFLSGSAVAAATAAGASIMPAEAKAANGQARVNYPSNRLANVEDLSENEPLNVAYPDDQAPGVLLKLGQSVPGGVGPDEDIVGFCTLCPHQGYPVSYNTEARTFNCPGHYSVFDPEQAGSQVWGQATQNLPQYILRVDEDGEIYAEGVDELIYGRLSNVL
ncbi:arsenate reductase (azurin) small subunit [Fodinicurvata fenggangensis]|uniref:arsenate reductase (azurin) small subunit n=1 Tax=Fodinicurvata fenggangensis TaxID=1121830 RepID=UPI00047B6C51|nr:arsenate reductase (azurin) small subunit [Fodinicurvata fenggangensis]